MKIDRNIFYSDVYHIVSQIPYGRVCTYGMLARICAYGWTCFSGSSSSYRTSLLPGSE